MKNLYRNSLSEFDTSARKHQPDNIRKTQHINAITSRVRADCKRVEHASKQTGHKRGKTNLGPISDEVILFDESLDPSDYSVTTEPPGKGFVHAVSADDIFGMLDLIPEQYLEKLTRIKLATYTKKRRRENLYGLQWHAGIYLFPLSDTLVEEYTRPPNPLELQEIKKYGGKFVQEGEKWKIEWNESTARDYYLNCVLIHELGHVNDERNTAYADREAYANWFADAFGYPESNAQKHRDMHSRIRKRHH